jgi:hypothetical protein
VGVKKTTYYTCPNGVEVELYEIKGEGHECFFQAHPLP